MSNFGSGSNSNGNFWYGNTTNFPGFLYKKNLGVGGRRSTKMAPGGNTTCNSSTDLYNKYKPGGGGVGASSTANRRSKNRLATICGSSNKCFPCYNTLGQYSSYTHNPNGFVPCPGTINISSSSGSSPGPGPSGTYTVTYLGNTNTGGAAPAPTTSYSSGTSVSILGNSGTFTKTGYQFAGWNTAADGSGDDYVGGDAFTMPSQNTTLYAKWIVTGSGFRITYVSGTGGTGTAPSSSGTFYPAYSTENIVGNTGSFTNATSPVFAGWNTLANGTGTSYPVGSPITMTQNYTLYAQWITNSPDVTLTYAAGTGGSGSAPASPTSYSAGLPANILANTGYTNGSLVFNGWNTAADGSGTSYPAGSKITMTSNTTLYAQWGSSPALTVTYNPNPPSGATTSGAVPAGPTQYPTNVQVPILGQGSLITPGYTFLGWQDASGSLYAPGYTFTSKTTTLFAQWAQGSPVRSCAGSGSSVFTFIFPFAQVIASTNTITIYTTALFGTTTTNYGSGTAPEGIISLTSKTVITSATITINTNTTYLNSANDYNYAHTITNVTDVTYWPTTPSVATISSITFPTFTNNPFLTPPTYNNSSPVTYRLSTRNCSNGCGLNAIAGGGVISPVSYNLCFFNQGVTLNYSDLTNNTVFIASPTNSFYSTDGGATPVVYSQTPNSLYPYNYGSLTPRSSAALTSMTIIPSNALEYIYPPMPNYTVQYDGNGATGGTIPAPQYFAPYTGTAFPYTVVGNTGTLTKTPSTFNKWNTKANGTGIDYGPGTANTTYDPNSPPGGTSLILYAIWV